MKKTINYKFKKYNSLGKEELYAANKVIKSGNLSGFLGSEGKSFLGGHYVRKFEKHVEKFYKTKYAISVNSWTSGLIAMIGSLDVEPGDEIIVSPWTMCATATAILHWNCIPVFADIDKSNYCISPNEVKKKITKKTKAIILVDIFGLASNIDEIKRVIKGKNIKIISDNAQAPYAFFKNKISGSNTQIGGFSFNYHKHIHSGEGGVVITNSKKLARRVRLIRNHGEAVIKPKENLNNILGYNFRLGEIEAAILINQYQKLKKIIKKKQILFRYLSKGLKNLKGLSLPKDNKYQTHNYYIYPINLDIDKLGFTRSKIVKLLKKEGVQGLMEGYTLLHQLPIFKKKIAYGNKGYPWKINSQNYKKKYNYICRNAEDLHNKTFVGLETCLYDLNKKDITLIIRAFHKVWNNLGFNLIK